MSVRERWTTDDIWDFSLQFRKRFVYNKDMSIKTGVIFKKETINKEKIPSQTALKNKQTEIGFLVLFTL